jgi:hypothetical protein
MSEDTSPPQSDIPREDPPAPPQTQLLRRQGDLPDWLDLIGSNLEELKMTHPDQYEGAGPTPHALSRGGNDILATEARKIIRNIVAGEAESMALREWIHQLNTSTAENNIKKKITVTTQNLGPSGIFRAMHVITDTLAMGPLVSYFQDILIHGQDIRSVRKSIGDINPDYQVFSDHGSFTPDDFRKLHYTRWGGER